MRTSLARLRARCHASTRSTIHDSGRQNVMPAQGAGQPFSMHMHMLVHDQVLVLVHVHVALASTGALQRTGHIHCDKTFVQSHGSDARSAPTNIMVVHAHGLWNGLS